MRLSRSRLTRTSGNISPAPVVKPLPFKGTFKSVIHRGKIKILFERVNLQAQFKHRYQIGGAHMLISSQVVQHG